MEALILRPSELAAGRQLSGLGISFLDEDGDKMLPTFDNKLVYLPVGSCELVTGKITDGVVKKGAVVDLFSGCTLSFENKSNNKRASIDVQINPILAGALFSSWSLPHTSILAPYTGPVAVRGITLKDMPEDSFMAWEAFRLRVSV